MLLELLADRDVDAFRDFVVLLLFTIVNSLKAVESLDRVLVCRVWWFGNCKDQVFNAFGVAVVPHIVSYSKILDGVNPIGPIVACVEHRKVVILDRHRFDNSCEIRGQERSFAAS